MLNFPKAPNIDHTQVRTLTNEYYSSVPQQNKPDFNLQLIQEKLDGRSLPQNILPFLTLFNRYTAHEGYTFCWREPWCWGMGCTNGFTITYLRSGTK